jgi:hypothetical protein
VQAFVGRRLATASVDRTARLWDAASGQALLRAPLRHAGPVRDVSFSPDGGRLLTCNDNNAERAWSAVTGPPLRQPVRHTGEPLTPALSHRGWGPGADLPFSPAGDRVVTASADGTAQVWQLGRNDWPADDLERLAELLGGGRIGAGAGSLVPLDVRALRRLWDELRTRRPEAVGPSP